MPSSSDLSPSRRFSLADFEISPSVFVIPLQVLVQDCSIGVKPPVYSKREDSDGITNQKKL